MPHCPNCGTAVDDGAAFCENCGTSVAAGQSQPGTPLQGNRPNTGRQRQGEHSPQSGPPPGRSGHDDGGISRRTLLLGGGGVAAAGGGWFFFLRGSNGPTGASAVADDYVRDIGDSDWEQAASLYHEASPPRQAIDSNDSVDTYGDYLAEQNVDVGKLRALDPTIESHEVWNHYPEYDRAAARDLSFAEENPPVSVEQIKQVSTVIRGDVSVLYDSERSEYYAGETSREAFFSTVVDDGSGWALWSVFHPV